MPDLSIRLPSELQTAVTARLAKWQKDDATRRLWAKDASVWTGADEAKWLGWLDVSGQQRAQLGNLAALAASAQKDGFTHVAVLGMGGSSLCPYVFATTFGEIARRPRLHVLDSTDPAQVRALEAAVDVPHTMFVVSSKSGSTLEPNILRDYFLDRAKDPTHFIAVTDPGSQLEKQARADGFRAIVAGEPTIGGRFSALSAFGLVPAALMGLDVGRLLDRADAMAKSCRESSQENPGVQLGAVMGECARHGVDKLTIIASPQIAALGAWLEQLVAESTGKLGKGIIPVDGERIAAPALYGKDRLFAYVRHEESPDAAQDAAIGALEQAGACVVRIAVPDRYALGAEFFRWEVATAVAGAVIGINPFDQPDVEASKLETRRLTDEVEKTGSLPKEQAPLTLGNGLEAALTAHLAGIKTGDYAALLAYVEMNEPHQRALQSIRHRIRNAKHVATTLGFGPRFLHSTGQAYKGGPNSGVFLQITCDDARDLPVPGRRYSFGVVKAAQARGDFAVLAARKRRALRVHLGPDVAQGLARLDAAVAKALG